MPKIKHDRPTIGILPGWSGLAGLIPDRYLTSVLKGIQSAARLKQCHLLLAWGLGRVDYPNDEFPAWPVVSADSDFVPVGPWNTDGLIVFAPLNHEPRSQYLRELSSQGFPILYIATGESDPMISVDNAGGIEKAVAHLTGHGHREIAFVAGDPDDKGDSQARLDAYQAAVRLRGLKSDPAMIAYGGHTVSGGYKAAKTMIDSGVGFTALIASDDNSAIGVMKAIREAGLQIPEDVAVIGFDDQPDAVAQVPPLASIHVPLMRMGEQAMALMFDHLVSGYQLESIKIPTRLVPRQSCGCMPRAVSAAGITGQASPSFSGHSDPGIDHLETVKQKLVDEMMASLPSQSLFPFGERTRRLCTRLVADFHTSLEQHNPAVFQAGLMTVLRELETQDENIDLWQSTITVLRLNMTQLPGIWGKPEAQRHAEALLHQARTAISESAQRQDYRHQYEWEIAAQALSQLTARLSAILDVQQAVETLEAGLSTIGIRHARAILFEAQDDDPIAGSLLLPTHSHPVSQRFATREFPPPDLYPADELLNLALVPLVFQYESLGYIAFDADNLGPCAMIARQLAATFKASRLHAQVSEFSLTDALTRVHNRRYFDLFLSNEVDRSRRSHHGLGIILLDIDYFKEYNDTFGHPAGDKALQLVARCLQQERRSADVVARVGGEEFALILPETDLEGASNVAEKIQAAVSNASELKRALTVSIGISVLHGPEIEADLIIQQADFALYEAKRRGRNQICIFDLNMKDRE
jgi:diguanylate cyclase (GGDEF)-like protein